MITGRPASSSRGLATEGRQSLGLSARVRPAPAAFTLIETLVVVALIAILSALMLPSLQGFFGVVGRRGGANALASALEQARLAAIENGTSAFVGFATGATNKDNAYSSVIVFRAKREDETGPDYVPLSRWLRFPAGVHLEPKSIDDAKSRTVSASGLLPRLGSEQLTSYPAIEFDRFGRVKNPPASSCVLKLGEGAVTGSDIRFREGTNALYAITVLPLTGRVQIAETGAP